MKCESLQNLLSSIEHLYQDCVISFVAIWSRYFGYPVHCVYIAIPSNTWCLSACTSQKCAWSRELLCAKCPTNLTADQHSMRYKTPTNFHGTEPSLIGRWHCDDALNVYQYVNIVSQFCYDMTIIYCLNSRFRHAAVKTMVGARQQNNNRPKTPNKDSKMQSTVDQTRLQNHGDSLNEGLLIHSVSLYVTSIWRETSVSWATNTFARK